MMTAIPLLQVLDPDSRETRFCLPIVDRRMVDLEFPSLLLDPCLPCLAFHFDGAVN